MKAGDSTSIRAKFATNPHLHRPYTQQPGDQMSPPEVIATHKPPQAEQGRWQKINHKYRFQRYNVNYMAHYSTHILHYPFSFG